MSLNIHDVCNYVIESATTGAEGNGVSTPLNHLKLQKLLYYVQAWHLAMHDRRFFEGSFEAWVHGPVNREIFDRFSESKSLFGLIDSRDACTVQTELEEHDRLFIDSVLEVYLPFSGTQLEEMTHKEHPWIKARGKLSPSMRCSTVIDENDMRDFYKAMLSTDDTQ